MENELRRDMHSLFCFYENDPTIRASLLKLYRGLISRNIKAIRKKLGLSYNRLSKASGLSSSTLLRLEKLEDIDGVPRYDTLRTLTAAFTECGEPTIVSDLLIDDYACIERLPGAVPLSPNDRKVLLSMEKLNDKGQTIAAERVEELTKIPEYQAPGEEDVSDER